MTYYRMSLLDVLLIVASNGLWVLWIIWRDEKIELPKEPK